MITATITSESQRPGYQPPEPEHRECGSAWSLAHLLRQRGYRPEDRDGNAFRRRVRGIDYTVTVPHEHEQVAEQAGTLLAVLLRPDLSVEVDPFHGIDSGTDNIDQEDRGPHQIAPGDVVRIGTGYATWTVETVHDNRMTTLRGNYIGVGRSVQRRTVDIDRLILVGARDAASNATET